MSGFGRDRLKGMPLSEADLYARLESLGIVTTTVRHRPVHTVDEAKAHRGALHGAHIKNLFLKDKKGALWLIVADEDRPIDLKALRRLIGAAPLSFASAELLRDVLGVEPGAVTPFAAINDTGGKVRVVLDAAILDAPMIHAHPLTNAATTAIAPTDLLRFLEASGHVPLVARW
jgi:Ala-tRNA(Pro) deacylase